MKEIDKLLKLNFKSVQTLISFFKPEAQLCIFVFVEILYYSVWGVLLYISIATMHSIHSSKMKGSTLANIVQSIKDYVLDSFFKMSAVLTGP